MTPAPSWEPQSSTVRWGQSRRDVSLPVHWTLSIAKVLGTDPNWDWTVAWAYWYPSILQQNMFIVSLEKNCLQFEQTCKLQERLLRHGDRRKLVFLQQRCFLRELLILPPGSPLRTKVKRMKCSWWGDIWCVLLLLILHKEEKCQNKRTLCENYFSGN